MRRAWRRVRTHVGKLGVVRSVMRRRELARLWRAKPLTFNEKVRYKMLADRRPLLTTFADKLAVRAYIESRVGPGHLTELYAVTTDPRSLTPDALPPEFVVKPTHASGAVVVVADFAPPDSSLRRTDAIWSKSIVRPESLDWSLLREIGDKWLSHRYLHEPSEWAYQGVPARLLAEELLEDRGGVAPDHKLCVFDGRAKMIEVHLDRFGVHTKCMYTTDWERIAAEWGHPAGVDVDRPAALPEMIEIAERLGAGTDFVRVDLYVLPERIVCGELTNYPLAGTGWFDPPAFDRELGELWTLPRRYPRR
jgi:hypothetical protein